MAAVTPRATAALEAALAPASIESATAAQLAAAVARAITSGAGIDADFAAEIEEAALAAPGVQNAGSDFNAAVFAVMKAALDAAPDNATYVDAITFVALAYAPGLQIEVNAERARRGYPPAPTAPRQGVAQPFTGNPPDATPTPTPSNDSTPTPTPIPAPSATPVEEPPVTPMNNA